MDAISSARYSMQAPEVLQLALQYVDLPHRLGPCALVCRAWRAAANAATSSISVRDCSQHRATALSAWLQRLGEEVEQLQVEARSVHPPPLLNLPCHLLTKLNTLSAIHLNVCPFNSGYKGSTEGCSSRGTGGSSPGSQQQQLAALTRLTQLHLDIVSWAGSLQQVSVLTSLRQLHLCDISCGVDETSPTESTSGTFGAAIGKALSHLVQLTSLYLGNWGHLAISDASLAHISRLQQLQALELWGVDITPARLATVPQSLTRLELWSMEHDDVLSSTTTTPALAQLTALQHFVHAAWKLNPLLLPQMAQLTYLYLRNSVPPDSAGEAALLAAVARMTLLQDLALVNCLGDSNAPAAAYAALTASSHLTHLQVDHDCEDMRPLPAGALNHMFVAGRQLPSLQDLLVNFRPLPPPQQQQAVPDNWALLQQGFHQLLLCCPGLQSLDLSFASVAAAAAAAFGDDEFAAAAFGYEFVDPEHQPLIKLDGLLALSGLTRLYLQGLLVDEAGITNLAQLTGLRELETKHTGVDYEVLLQLTNLKRLVDLQLPSSRHPLHFCSTAPAGSPPNVWLRLQVQCVSSCKKCAQLVLQQQHAQLQEAHAQLAESQRQLAEARQELAAQQAV